ncbi:acyl carrier protein [Nitrosomonas sp.]|uniref:acyl carrier protein n=1 Tax=Nitrosomonas sp. TaxID=42353 RepID=UPI0025F0D5E7|nr:phosphopantetheine-binding protein [Nitrosomonas sp.]
MINTNHTLEIKKILTDTLGLGKRLDAMEPDTRLLGSIPELDSVAVVTVILALEKKFSISIEDDEISAKTFEKLSSLVNFVEIKLAEKNEQLV